MKWSKSPGNWYTDNSNQTCIYRADWLGSTMKNLCGRKTKILKLAEEIEIHVFLLLFFDNLGQTNLSNSNSTFEASGIGFCVIHKKIVILQMLWLLSF